jgi:hypothetical protein
LAGNCTRLQLLPAGGVLQATNHSIMKTTLLSVLTATLLGFASQASGRPYDAADFTAIMFAIGLVGWTIDQYSRPVRALSLARPIRLPSRHSVQRPPAPDGRLAA